MTSFQLEKGRGFRALHAGDPLVIPGPLRTNPAQLLISDLVTGSK